jgi:hypothetical protein
VVADRDVEEMPVWSHGGAARQAILKPCNPPRL